MCIYRVPGKGPACKGQDTYPLERGREGSGEAGWVSYGGRTRSCAPICRSTVLFSKTAYFFSVVDKHDTFISKPRNLYITRGTARDLFKHF